MTDATVLAEGAVSAGPLGFVIIVLLAAATVLLIRNMNGRLKRLPRSFPDAPPRRDDPEVPSQR